jgi:hypothetical protein
LCVVKHLLQMFTVHCKSVSETRTCLQQNHKSLPSIHLFVAIAN